MPNKPMQNKSPQMIEALRRIVPNQMKAIDEAKCPICFKPIDMREFRDTKSEKEYYISGMCQNCQDEVFD